jgi:hypothetical protein
MIVVSDIGVCLRGHELKVCVNIDPDAKEEMSFQKKEICH